MNNRDWERFGQEIYQSVQDAVNTGDFSRLNQTVTSAVDGAFQTLGRGVRDVGDAMNRKMDDYARNRQTRQFSQEQAYEYCGTEQEYAQQRSSSKQGFEYVHKENATQEKASADLALYAGTTGISVAGWIFMIGGYALTGIFWLAALIVFGAAFAEIGFGSGVWITIGMFAVLAVIGNIFAAAASRKLKRIRRFKRYQQVLNGRGYCDIKELSDKIGKTPQFVLKDLQKMISKGWFRQGRLDAQKTCLIASNEAYEQYSNLMKQMEIQKQEEARLQAEQKAREADPDYDPQLQEIIRCGDEYVARIRRSNDAIPGEEISAKIDHMEMLVDRIFDRVEQNPASVKDIQKLMDYYLPTTMKLLEAYEELDAQPIQGENILASKHEIEQTLDTLNIAFEKLLDSLFQTTAWDVSADAMVLKTMLAQEGLTNKDF